MRVLIRWGTAAWLMLALTALVRAQAPPIHGLGVPPPEPIFPRLNAALTKPHQTTPVAPAMEIEVLDPNVDPRGNPAVVLRPATTITSIGPEGRMVVDIPPTVLVHRYYYTGDRSFQAGFLPGGPCIVVANDPKTGERLYVPVQFPPGAPRVTYTSTGIDYDYGTQGVCVTFCGLLHVRPKVTYRNGVPFTQQADHVYTSARDVTRRLVSRTGIPECVDKVATGTKSFVITTVDFSNDVGKAIIAPPLALIRATPLANMFTESPEAQAEKARNAAVQRAQALRQDDAFIKTIR